METTTPLSQGNTTMTINPVDHYTGARLSWRGWRAHLEQTDDRTNLVRCPHECGHRTVDAAKRCGLAMWRTLP